MKKTALEKLITKSARLKRETEANERAMGKLLAPILNRLVKTKNRFGLLDMGNKLNAVGSFNGRFFYEAAYVLRKESIEGKSS